MRRFLLPVLMLAAAACTQDLAVPDAPGTEPATANDSPPVSTDDPTDVDGERLAAEDIRLGDTDGLQQFGSPFPLACGPSDALAAAKHAKILGCTTQSSDYSFTLSGVPICGVSRVRPSNPPQPKPVPAEAPALDYDKFAEYMRGLDGKTVGYAWALVDTRPGKGMIATSGSHGYATWKKDGKGGGTGLKMTPNTLTNVGSTTKVLGGVSLLRVFEQLDASKNPQYINLDTFLDIPFLYFLPKNAKKVADPTLAQITIRDLLQHKSGLRLGTSLTPSRDLYNLLNHHIDCNDHGARSYNNMGFVILRYLITFINAPEKRTVFDNADFTSPVLGSASVDRTTREYYTQFVNTKMKQAVGYNFTSVCNPDEWVDSAQMFDNITDRNGLYLNSEGAGGCTTQGGNWTSVYDWAKFLLAFENDKLVSEHARNLMNNRNLDEDGILGNDRLVWNRFNDPNDGTRSDWFQNTHDMGTFFGHGGGHTREISERSYTAAAGIIQLPWGFYGVAAVNSGELHQNTLMTRLKNAFARAAGFAGPLP